VKTSRKEMKKMLRKGLIRLVGKVAKENGQIVNVYERAS